MHRNTNQNHANQNHAGSATDRTVGVWGVAPHNKQGHGEGASAPNMPSVGLTHQHTNHTGEPIPTAGQADHAGSGPPAPWGLRGSPPQNNDDRPGEGGRKATEQGRPEVVGRVGLEPTAKGL
jgi:hypothetical protein